MIVERTSRLEAPAEDIWAAVLRMETFAYVAAPVLRFRAAELADTRWMPGLELEDRLLLFGFVPLGRHRIRIESVDHDALRLRSAERSRLLRRWDHEIVVEPIDADTCRYSDRLDLDAGALTGLVGILAGVLLRYRHVRWRGLARKLPRG